MILPFINIRKVPREMLKTEDFALGFQHLPRDLVNVNEWKIIFDSYIISYSPHYRLTVYLILLLGLECETFVLLLPGNSAYLPDFFIPMVADLRICSSSVGLNSKQR